MDEIWKSIKEPILSKYEVSNTGKIRNKRSKKERNVIESKDHLLVNLIPDDKGFKNYRILANLILLTFCSSDKYWFLCNGLYKEGFKILYKDGDYHNTSFDNLGVVNKSGEIVF